MLDTIIRTILSPILAQLEKRLSEKIDALIERVRCAELDAAGIEDRVVERLASFESRLETEGFAACGAIDENNQGSEVTRQIIEEFLEERFNDFADSWFDLRHNPELQETICDFIRNNIFLTSRL